VRPQEERQEEYEADYCRCVWSRQRPSNSCTPSRQCVSPASRRDATSDTAPPACDTTARLAELPLNGPPFSVVHGQSMLNLRPPIYGGLSNSGKVDQQATHGLAAVAGGPLKAVGGSVSTLGAPCALAPPNPTSAERHADSGYFSGLVEKFSTTLALATGGGWG
jgi:hypothetical protein